MNLKMPDLKRAFELAGFSDVKTLLSSGNVLFSARAAQETTLARRAEAALEKHVGTSFFTLVRSIDSLQTLLASDPFAAFRLKPGSKRVVTFLSAPPNPKPRLPVELGGARILAVAGNEVFTAYVPSPKGPVFMTLLEKTFGKDITTRTWDTVTKLAR
jgi:uncharacterized protein (DUF1697 family)